jgi:hypothetical protein
VFQNGFVQFDLVAVRVFAKCNDAGAVFHRSRRAGDVDASGGQFFAGFVDIGAFEADMAVGLALFIRLFAAPVQGQF